MSLSSIIKKTEELLEDVLQTIQKDYEGPYPVLCEMDRNRFVEEEQSLQKQLEEVRESESNCSSWIRSLLLRPSPQAATRCLRDAEELHRCVKEDMNAKLRTRLAGRSNPLPLSSNGQGSAGTLGLPLLEDSLGRPGVVVVSPLNMRCSLQESELSEANINPAVHHRDYTSDINDAINSPLETSNESHDGTSNSSGRSYTRRRPPPPPPIRQIALPSHSRTSSDTSSNPGGDSPRRSPPVRRPAPPPPQLHRQSRSPRISTNISSPSPGPFPDPAMISSICSFAQDISSLASSVVASAPGASHGRHGKRGGSYVTTKTNCVEITDSNVKGFTFNNNATKCSGAVIHETTMPPLRVP